MWWLKAAWVGREHHACGSQVLTSPAPASTHSDPQPLPESTTQTPAPASTHSDPNPSLKKPTQTPAPPCKCPLRPQPLPASATQTPAPCKCSLRPQPPANAHSDPSPCNSDMSTALGSLHTQDELGGTPLQMKRERHQGGWYLTPMTTG